MSAKSSIDICGTFVALRRTTARGQKWERIHFSWKASCMTKRSIRKGMRRGNSRLCTNTAAARDVVVGYMSEARHEGSFDARWFVHDFVGDFVR